ncbi:MAG: N-acetylmuramoyl-L-alanine amidase family protein [Anaerovoracaceae bacterium]|jgi:N-acetylmuramoyl-L-alanine amidase CwlA
MNTNIGGSIIQMLAPTIPTGARSGRKLKSIVGVTIHNTGNSAKGAGAISHGRYLQGTGKDKKASWHYAVDDKNIVQSIPENEVAWHAGDGNGNGNMATIGIEICMNPDSDLRVATDKAAFLTADILKRHNLKLIQVFQHNHWSGKNCPQMLRAGKPYSWQTFIEKVEDAMSIGDIDNKVKAKFGFSDSTMEYLNSHPYSKDLYEKLLAPKSLKETIQCMYGFSDGTIEYLYNYKYGRELLERLLGGVK